jgi:hypothetical protein
VVCLHHEQMAISVCNTAARLQPQTSVAAKFRDFHLCGPQLGSRESWHELCESAKSLFWHRAVGDAGALLLFGTDRMEM